MAMLQDMRLLLGRIYVDAHEGRKKARRKVEMGSPCTEGRGDVLHAHEWAAL